MNNPKPVTPRILFTLGLLGLLPACAHREPRAIDQLYGGYEKQKVSAIQALIKPGEDDLGIDSDTRRNEVMNAMILFIDHDYYRREKNLYSNKAWGDFAGSVLGAGLGTAGAIAGGGTAQVMSALVAALETTKTSLNKDVLQGQTIVALIAKMRQLRNDKLVVMRQRMVGGLDAYPVSQALIDLLEYYNAGTFISALQDLTESASAQAAKAKKAADILDGKINRIKTVDQILKEAGANN